MSRLRIGILFIARVCLSLIFITSGIRKILSWQEVQDGLKCTLCQWQIYMEGVPFIEDIFAFLVPLVPILLIVATCLELGGGVLTLCRQSARFGAILLLFFLIPVTVIYHAFWFEIGDQFQAQVVKFLSNLSIVGGLLVLAASPTLQGKEVPYKNKLSK